MSGNSSYVIIYSGFAVPVDLELYSCSLHFVGLPPALSKQFLIIERVLSKYDLSLSDRAENMPLDAFIDIANEIS